MSKFYICIKCYEITSCGSEPKLVCSGCGKSVQRKHYRKLIEVGTEIIRYGVLYRRRYESDLAEHGNLNKRYSLSDPSEVLAFLGAAFAAGIVGNASYEVLKFTLRKLMDSLNKEADRKRKFRSQRFTSEEDVKLFLSMLEDDEKFERFVDDLKDFKEGMQNVDPEVRSAIISEERARKRQAKLRLVIEEIKLELKQRKRSFVYVSKNGKSYHAYGCHYLNGTGKKVNLKSVVKTHTPCKTCNPLSS